MRPRLVAQLSIGGARLLQATVTKLHKPLSCWIAEWHRAAHDLGLKKFESLLSSDSPRLVMTGECKPVPVSLLIHAFSCGHSAHRCLFHTGFDRSSVA